MGVTNTSNISDIEKLVTAREPGAIEAMELRGQGELVGSTLLPVQVQGDQADIIALGIVLGDPVADDPLFRQAELPAGWSKQGSDHDMWSYVVDEHGKQRVAVFYKAAFYDRRAFMRLA